MTKFELMREIIENSDDNVNVILYDKKTSEEFYLGEISQFYLGDLYINVSFDEIINFITDMRKDD